MIRGVRLRFGVLFQAFEDADDRVDLAGVFVRRRDRLSTAADGLDLIAGPLDAVVIAPGFLLLLDLVGLAGQLVLELLTQARERVKHRRFRVLSCPAVAFRGLRLHGFLDCQNAVVAVARVGGFVVISGRRLPFGRIVRFPVDDVREQFR